MQVETYEIEDATSAASAMANDSEAMELIARLGLSGQQRISNPETATRIPYRAMEKREMLVYRAVCDEVKALENYDADAIPLRVLQCAALAKETEMFNGGLHVWYPSEARIDDPVLVGIVKTRLYPNDDRYAGLTKDTFYMLARWGKTLLPFEKLEEIAIKLHRSRRLTELKKAMKEVESALQITQETDDLEELSKHVSFNA